MQVHQLPLAVFSGVYFRVHQVVSAFGAAHSHLERGAAHQHSGVAIHLSGGRFQVYRIVDKPLAFQLLYPLLFRGGMAVEVNEDQFVIEQVRYQVDAAGCFPPEFLLGKVQDFGFGGRLGEGIHRGKSNNTKMHKPGLD